MNILQKRIENLCDEIIGRILALMQANSVSEVVLTDNDNPVYVIWFDKTGDPCECSVHKVTAVGEGITLEVHDKITGENYKVTSRHEAALANPVWLNEIAGIVLHNIFPSIQVGTFGYMFDVPLMITAVLVFGGQFGARTVVAALFTPGFMNILTRLVYSDAAFTADGINLDPALLLGGSLNLSNDLLLTCIIGAVVIGVGQGMVVRTQATTGGTDIIAMLLQKYAGIKFSTGIFLADCVVILSGLVVIGFGLGTGDSSGSGWVLTLYSLITIFICSRVVARVIDGASYDKLLFIISDENEKLRTFILEDLERSATFIKARGMYSEEEKDMIFLVVDRKEVHAVQRKVQEIDPKAFFVVTDAYDTYGEGFKPFPEAGAIQAQ